MQLLICGFLDSCAFFLNILCVVRMSNSLSLQFRDTLNAIMTMGHSRVPVYSGNPTNIIGLVLVILFLSMHKIVFYGLLIAKDALPPFFK